MNSKKGLSNIKLIREKYGLSQEDLAVEIGVKRYQIADWEQGRSAPNIDQLRQLSLFLNKSIDFLTGYTDYNYYNTLQNSLNDYGLFQYFKKLGIYK
ncbi:MAG: helix-turn-helix transcriptional regulator [Bacilli bacterium]|nr:helix-turn-helix transcriptional regulator [Bacilli bacterium]